ncbi:hypothetical protein RND81_01G136900 [Saponaria officinalis]|uniref:Uncharacterized protein n=1 Tax=Saponaria officinalis TaxID=3572 RepID=A0AAW1NE83_SAPOF
MKPIQQARQRRLLALIPHQTNPKPLYSLHKPSELHFLSPSSKTISSISTISSNPIKGLEFRNQPCHRFRRNAVIKISGSMNNPRKTYFKCLNCELFVKWVSEEHVIFTKSFKIPPSIEEFETSSSNGVSELIMHSKRDVVDFVNYMKHMVKVIKLMFFFVVVVVVVVVVVAVMK